MVRMLAVCLTALLPALAAAERTVGALDTPGYAQSLTLAGDRVYLADGEGGLRIIDVSDPAAPRQLGAFDTPGYAWEVAIAPTWPTGSRACASSTSRIPPRLAS